MAQVSKYRYLLNQYPETVQKEQFRIICHISKRTARYLLQSGLVPCVQSGKKTRNYTIMKGGRSKTPVNSSWHKNDRPVTIPPSVRPKEILWRERR